MRKHRHIRGAACGGPRLSASRPAAPGSESGGGDDDALVVGATAVPAGEVLTYIKDNLAEKAGLKLEIKEFTDYVLPNTALQEGSLDANLYQNEPYLDDFNKSKGTDLVPVGRRCYLPPMGVYSKKVKDVTELAERRHRRRAERHHQRGPRAEAAGRQGCDHAQGRRRLPATPEDIAANPRNLKFKELEAAQLPRSLDDVDAAVINGNYALEADLSPTEDAIAAESPKDNPYGNFLAVRRATRTTRGSRSSRSSSPRPR